jgi:phosphatidylserine/phosphatidylglycerophosphate/cardiolipin synthase-like enzyme
MRALRILLVLTVGCGSAAPTDPAPDDGKADELSGTAARAKLPDPNAAEPPPASWRPPAVSRWPDAYVIFNNTGCGQTCAAADQEELLARSVMMKMLNAAIRSVKQGGTIRVANFNISASPGVQPLHDALRFAMEEKGATVKIVMDSAQDVPDSRTRKLAEDGAEVRFVVGLRHTSSFEPDVERTGIMHSKMLVVDDKVLVAGSNNFSTGAMTTSEENSVVLRGTRHAARIAAFTCQFDRMFEAGVPAGEPQRADDDPIRHAAISGIDACETEDVLFPPSGALTEDRSRTFSAISRVIRDARVSIDLAPDMLAHPGIVSAIARRARRARDAGEPFAVRLVLDGSEGALGNPAFGECLAAAAERDGTDIQVRYWAGNGEIFQLLHHKMMLIDAGEPDGALWNGSANYSAKAMRWSFENVTRFPAADLGDVVDVFAARFETIFAAARPAAELGGKVPACPLDLDDV